MKTAAKTPLAILIFAFLCAGCQACDEEPHVDLDMSGIWNDMTSTDVHDDSARDSDTRDSGTHDDMSWQDLSSENDAQHQDTSLEDIADFDDADLQDLGHDAAGDMMADPGQDADANEDMMAGTDMETMPDMDPPHPTGLTTPCENGPGMTLLRWRYWSNSTSPVIEVWDASCQYSLAQNSACNVREVYPGFGSISRTSEGYPIVTSTHYIRARFSVSQIPVNGATLYIRGRSFSTSASTGIRAWSPLYGDAFGGPVSNAFDYQWYDIDWSQHLFTSDSPTLTAIQIYAHQGSNRLAVRSVELCLH